MPRLASSTRDAVVSRSRTDVRLQAICAAFAAALGAAPPAAAQTVGSAEPAESQIILTGYEPNYFIMGTSRESAVKFQLSLKLDLWPNPSQHSIYFGYTQKCIWDVLGRRDGFVDSNYAPELFYGFFDGQASGETGATIDHVRLGVLHESNGRAGSQLRSWNRVYGLLAGGGALGAGHSVRAMLEAWLPFLMSENNTDIIRYLGYGRVGGSYVLGPFARDFWGSVRFTATYAHGFTLDSKQALDLSLEWRPGYGGRVSWWRFTPNLFAQLYSGYGEYLLAYDENHTSFRIGISIEDRVYWVNGAAH